VFCRSQYHDQNKLDEPSSPRSQTRTITTTTKRQPTTYRIIQNQTFRAFINRLYSRNHEPSNHRSTMPPIHKKGALFGIHQDSPVVSSHAQTRDPHAYAKKKSAGFGDENSVGESLPGKGLGLGLGSGAGAAGKPNVLGAKMGVRNVLGNKSNGARPSSDVLSTKQMDLNGTEKVTSVLGKTKPKSANLGLGKATSVNWETRRTPAHPARLWEELTARGRLMGTGRSSLDCLVRFLLLRPSSLPDRQATRKLTPTRRSIELLGMRIDRVRSKPCWVSRWGLTAQTSKPARRWGSAPLRPRWESLRDEIWTRKRMRFTEDRSLGNLKRSTGLSPLSLKLSRTSSDRNRQRNPHRHPSCHIHRRSGPH